MSKKRTGIYVKCEICGKEVYKTISQYNAHEHHFCSAECSVEYRHRSHTDLRQCEFCQKEFEARRSSPQRFCSMACQNEWQKGNVGVKNVRFTRVQVECEECGELFYVKKYKTINGQHLFCSTHCRQKWYAEVWSQRPEWKEESSKRAISILKNNPPQLNSLPQQLTNRILDELHIEYLREYPVGLYSVDNYLCDTNKFIEVMGDYWHTNPIIYEKPLYDTQVERVMKDNDKRDVIFQHSGVYPLYLWESDLANNYELCKQLVKKFISEELQNYNSFNYHLANDNLILNKNIIIPFQEDPSMLCAIS